MGLIPMEMEGWMTFLCRQPGAPGLWSAVTTRGDDYEDTVNIGAGREIILVGICSSIASGESHEKCALILREYRYGQHTLDVVPQLLRSFVD
jgi:hypothetical protein